MTLRRGSTGDDLGGRRPSLPPLASINLSQENSSSIYGFAERSQRDWEAYQPPALPPSNKRVSLPGSKLW